MMLKSTMLSAALAIFALVGASANAAPINLTALGLEAAPAAFATETASTSLFGGVAFSSDSFAAAVTYNIAVAGSLPFGGTDFALTAVPVSGAGSLTGTSSHVGWDVDLVQVLLTVSANTGAFSGVSTRVLAEVSGSFGADPLGAGGGPATLGNFVSSSITLTNVSAIPLPVALPVMALALGGVAMLARRRER